MDNSSEEHLERSCSIDRCANNSKTNKGQKSQICLQDSSETSNRFNIETKRSKINVNKNERDNNRKNGYEELDRRQDKHYHESINRPLVGEGDDLNNNNISTTQHSSDNSSAISHCHQVNEETTFTDSDSNNSNNNKNQDNDSVTRSERQLNNSGRNCVIYDGTKDSRRQFNVDYKNDTDYSSHEKKESATAVDYHNDKNNHNDDMNSINHLNVTYNYNDEEKEDDDNYTKQWNDLGSYDSSSNCKLQEQNDYSKSVRPRRNIGTLQKREQEKDFEIQHHFFDDNLSDDNLKTQSNSNKTDNSDDFVRSNNWKDKPKDTLVCKSGSNKYSSQCSESLSVIRKSILFIKGSFLLSATNCNMPSNSNRYQTFAQSDENLIQDSRSRLNESHRSVNSNRKYSKLNNQYLRLTKKYTIAHELKRLALLLLIVSVSCVILWKIYEVLIDEYNYLGVVESPSNLGEFKYYGVSTDALPCAKVGSALLAKGGSAVDAAVGTLLCMGVVLPNSLGLGGGCLMTIYDRKKKEATVIDGREVAPDYATENMFANESLKASRGPLSIGIPGELAAYWKAHQMFGKLNWSELFDDSIGLAENGSPLVEHLAFALRARNHAKYITPPLAKLMTNNATGQYYDQGEIFIQKELANTLKRIRDNGAKEFYGGLTGQLFIQDLKEQGGKISLENLMDYEALVKPPLVFNLTPDLNIYTQPPPGSGIVLSIILRVMKELGYYKKLKPQSSFEGSSLYYHRLIEAFKFAYAQRAGLEDKPDDVIRMQQLMEKLSSNKFIKEVAMGITNETHVSEYYGGIEYFSDDHGTAHVSVVDAEGNAAAVTSSVNLYFGSGLLSPSTGITYNDVMDDFTSPNLVNKFNLAPSKFNRIRPGKRPLSSMAPSVFTDSEGNVRLVIGGSGGSKITTAIASVSLRNCFLGEDIKTAIDGPRLHHQFLPDKIMYEHNFPKELLNSLADRKHSLDKILDRSSVIVAVTNDQINRTRKRITANSDYRKGGSVAGL